MPKQGLGFLKFDQPFLTDFLLSKSLAHQFFIHMYVCMYLIPTPLPSHHESLISPHAPTKANRNSYTCTYSPHNYLWRNRTYPRRKCRPLWRHSPIDSNIPSLHSSKRSVRAPAKAPIAIVMSTCGGCGAALEWASLRLHGGNKFQLASRVLFVRSLYMKPSVASLLRRDFVLLDYTRHCV